MMEAKSKRTIPTEPCFSSSPYNLITTCSAFVMALQVEIRHTRKGEKTEPLQPKPLWHCIPLFS